MVGRETVRRLIEIDPGVKAIVSSGYSNGPIMSDFKGYGFRGVVAKPYTTQELSRTLEALIKGPLHQKDSRKSQRVSRAIC